MGFLSCLYTHIHIYLLSKLGYNHSFAMLPYLMLTSTLPDGYFYFQARGEETEAGKDQFIQGQVAEPEFRVWLAGSKTSADCSVIGM